VYFVGLFFVFIIDMMCLLVLMGFNQHQNVSTSSINSPKTKFHRNPSCWNGYVGRHMTKSTIAFAIFSRRSAPYRHESMCAAH